MSKRIIPALLALLLSAGGLFCISSQAKDAAPMKDCYPIVFVHGMGGWGDGAPINGIMPHWGMTAGSVKKYLNSQGYECYAASVGPISSAWDRACELYAQITGTRVDYGAAHAAAHNHDRYGEDYGRPLVPGWNAKERKLHLIGHSFGGATARLFAQLCEKGSAAECAATPAGELSALFSGDLKGRIASITTLGAPHNGSTASEPNVGGINVFATVFKAMMVMGEIVPLQGDILPFRLGHFGISLKSFWRAPWKVADTYKSFIEGSDNVFSDTNIDGAAVLNKTIQCLPGITYFSYAAQMSHDDGSGNQVPNDGMSFLFKSASRAMGLKREPYRTAGGVLIGDEWLPNDGLVNVISALYPFNAPHKTYNAKKVETGIWQVMPMIENWDHFDFGGGQSIGGAEGVMEFYLALAQMLEGI